MLAGSFVLEITEPMMSGKHYKGQEVSCCIKYFIFGFNIIFWVSARHHFFVYNRLSLAVNVMYGYLRSCKIQILCLCL